LKALSAEVRRDTLQCMRHLTLFALFTLTLFADDSTRTVASAAPANARFQIVQSEIVAKGTFKLDRFTGQVWQFVLDSEGVSIWSSMKIDGAGQNNAIAPTSTSPRFQIFLSGIAFKFTYLLDTVTGVCWQLVGSSTSNDSWQMILSAK